LFSNPVD